MADTTTVKVAVSTRDEVKAWGAERGQTADQVIQDGLRAMRREARRRLMREESLALRDDLVEQAEMRAVREDMARLAAG